MSLPETTALPRDPPKPCGLVQRRDLGEVPRHHIWRLELRPPSTRLFSSVDRRQCLHQRAGDVARSWSAALGGADSAQTDSQQIDLGRLRARFRAQAPGRRSLVIRAILGMLVDKPRGAGADK